MRLCVTVCKSVRTSVNGFHVNWFWHPTNIYRFEKIPQPDFWLEGLIYRLVLLPVFSRFRCRRKTFRVEEDNFACLFSRVGGCFFQSNKYVVRLRWQILVDWFSCFLMTALFILWLEWLSLRFNWPSFQRLNFGFESSVWWILDAFSACFCVCDETLENNTGGLMPDCDAICV